MINGNILHYIASGNNHTKINSVRDKRSVDWVKASIKKMHTEDYQFGFLYNAFTEKVLGKVFSKLYKDDCCDIHADSGGLQMITLGKTPTPELKEQVYRHQAEHSTIAMSFDEIPVTTSGVLDFANRRFEPQLVEEKAIASGKNLADQLTLFEKLGTGTRPLLIGQGNDMDSYLRWVDIVQKQVPKDLLPMIGGIALAGSTMGNGDLENIRTAFYYTQMDLQFDCKQVHLLGVGSMSRFIPTMVFMKSGLYKDLVISIDSTTHTGNISRNAYFDHNSEQVKLGRNYRPDKYQTLFELCSFFDIEAESPRELYELIVEHRMEQLKEMPNADDMIHKHLQARLAMSFSSIKNTMDAFADFLHDRNVLRYTKRKMVVPFKGLGEVSNLADFHHWEREFASRIKSNPVRTQPTNTLMEFFD